MQVKISQAIPMITACIKAKLVPMLTGSPGVGKSGIVHQIAKDYSLKVIDLRLSQCDPTDLLGMPSVRDGRAGYFPMDTFPIEGDPIPKGYNGWLLFLDEFNSAPPAVQAAAYKVVLDRMIGTYNLHKNVAIVCAGNLETDNAIVQPMSTALQSRLVHLELMVDNEEFIRWAQTNNVDHRITDFIKFKPSCLMTFSADHTDKTYACPRTWSFADRLLKITEEGSSERLPLLAGTLSEGVAREFLTFCKIYQSLPKIEQIITKPKEIPVPEEPSILFALTGSLAQHATEANFAAMLTFVKRMPVEFQVVMLRESIRRHPELLSHEACVQWQLTTSADLF